MVGDNMRLKNEETRSGISMYVLTVCHSPTEKYMAHFYHRKVCETYQYHGIEPCHIPPSHFEATDMPLSPTACRRPLRQTERALR
jgi:hypothetical protein